MKAFYIFLFLVSTAATAQEKRLRLVFAGDIMAHQSQLNAARRQDGRYDFSESLVYIQDVLREAHLAAGNLELTFAAKPPYAGYPTFRTPGEFATALRKAGFNLLLAANNHANDGSAEGVAYTIKVLDENHFYYTGTFANPLEKEARYPLIIYKNGFKLAVLNYTYGLNAPHIRPPVVINQMVEAEMEKDIDTARRMQPDAIILILHWGEEYTDTPTENQRQLARRLVEWGADMVIGAHPHVVQPIEWIDNSRGESKLVAYSLGNFSSGMRLPGTEGGILLAAELKKEDREVHLDSCHFIPIWCYPGRDKTGRRTHHVLPAAAYEENAGAPFALPAWRLRQLKSFTRQTRQLLQDSGCPERKVSLPEAKKEEQHDRFRNSSGRPE